MNTDLRELWVSIIGAFIRFWDNRFAPNECLSCGVLTTEIARLRAENSSLVDRLLGQVSQPTYDSNDADSKLETKPIRQFQTPWRTKQRELELAHRKDAQQAGTQGTDLETFEKNLQELEG